MIPTRRIFASFFLFFCLLGLFWTSSSFGEADSKSNPALKEAMAQMGALLSGIEISRMRQEKPDWQEIGQTISKMSKLLDKIKKMDTDHSYQPYTDVLGAALLDLKRSSAKKDKNIYNQLEDLTEKCFRCHAAHRSDSYWR